MGSGERQRCLRGVEGAPSKIQKKKEIHSRSNTVGTRLSKALTRFSSTSGAGITRERDNYAFSLPELAAVLCSSAFNSALTSRRVYPALPPPTSLQPDHDRRTTQERRRIDSINWHRRSLRRGLLNAASPSEPCEPFSRRSDLAGVHHVHHVDLLHVLPFDLHYKLETKLQRGTEPGERKVAVVVSVVVPSSGSISTSGGVVGLSPVVVAAIVV